MAHCTEKTNAASSINDWQTLFENLNQQLTVMDTGCCGMSGTYGHERDNLETSKHIYQLSWSTIVNEPSNHNHLMATGYSCRSQVKREDNIQLPHPLQVLLNQII
jgi:Fe-S oxidoreductase